MLHQPAHETTLTGCASPGNHKGHGMDQMFSEGKRFADGRPVEGCLRSKMAKESGERRRMPGHQPAAEAVTSHPRELHELQHRLQSNATLVNLAKIHLETISSFLNSIPHVLSLTDRDGIILSLIGDPAHREEVCLAPGHDCSVRALGPNGAGTALAANHSVAVVGPEHACRALQEWTTLGCPFILARAP